MMTTSEKATQESTTLPLRSVHHTGFLWALCQELVLSTTQRFVARLSVVQEYRAYRRSSSPVSAAHSLTLSFIF